MCVCVYQLTLSMLSALFCLHLVMQALPWHGPIQCDLVCGGVVQHFIHNCKLTSQI